MSGSTYSYPVKEKLIDSHPLGIKPFGDISDQAWFLEDLGCHPYRQKQPNGFSDLEKDWLSTELIIRRIIFAKKAFHKYNVKDQLDENVKSDEKLSKLFKSLKGINSKLWIIEDDKRQCERDKDFGEKFIKLSREVHFLNDDRAKIKLEINNYTGSTIKEVKEYTSY